MSPAPNVKPHLKKKIETEGGKERENDPADRSHFGVGDTLPMSIFGATPP